MRPLLAATAEAPAHVAIPAYLARVYWWAYVHPRAIRVFEREWLVNLILFGNYRSLGDLALAALGERLAGSTLQVACVYGSLTPHLRERLAPGARLDVVDVVPAQLSNLARKLAPDPRVRLHQANSTDLPFSDASCDRVLLFFLLHEQPAAVRRQTLREALRVLRPGGRLVIVDYHRPRAWHPLRPLLRLVFRYLEPFAIDLWHHALPEFLPADIPATVERRTTSFGDIYQLLVLRRDA